MRLIARTVGLTLVGMIAAGAAAQAYAADGNDYALTTLPAFQSGPAPSMSQSPVWDSAATPGVQSAHARDSLALSPPGHGRPLTLGVQTQATRGRRNDALHSLVTVGSSLALVLGLFFLFAKFLRRATPGGSALLPGEVVEVLGRAPLAARQQIHLLRCGNKLLLVSVTPAGVETLTEITEPAEVDRLAGLCRQGQPGSVTAVFRNVLQQFGREQVAPGLLGNAHRDNLDLANSGMFERGRDTWEGRNG